MLFRIARLLRLPRRNQWYLRRQGRLDGLCGECSEPRRAAKGQQLPDAQAEDIQAGAEGRFLPVTAIT
jgi:hypothetical protein